LKIEDLAEVPTLLVALDFDGTMAPIVEEPSAARALSGFAEVLGGLAASPGVSVAVLTGRDQDGIRPLLSGFPPLWLGLSHGRDLLAPEAASLLPGGDDLRLSELRSLEPPEGVRREDKAHSCAFHWRGRAQGRPDAWLSGLAGRAKSLGLTVLEGRMVVEFLLPGPGKLLALQEIQRRTGAKFVVFAGDDVTDQEAIGYASRHGVGIHVRSSERSWETSEEVLCLEEPAALLEWLRGLLKLRTLNL
jgi:trehalose 6-phosphate phosphatase